MCASPGRARQMDKYTICGIVCFMTHNPLEDSLSLPESRQQSFLSIPEVLTLGELAAAQNNPIAVANAESLQSDEYSRIAMGESLGGNAGIVEIDGHAYSCVGVNGHAYRQTGHISAFGNIQDVDPEIVQRDGHFTLKVAVWSFTAPVSRSVFVELHNDGISLEGLNSLLQGATLVNHNSLNDADQ